LAMWLAFSQILKDSLESYDVISTFFFIS
jgi:hypothetical protein